jgi:putative acetyltransferase
MIRSEQLGDILAIRQVNRAAFGRDNEADLVDRLRGLPATLSLVAVDAEQVIGHIFFSPVEIEGIAVEPGFMLGLAPLAVLPVHQRQGIGSQLIRQGLEHCRQLGCEAVVVLGNPAYYGRFGFIPAVEKNLRCEYEVPEGAFRVLELKPGSLDEYQGLVKYRPEFETCE